MNTKAENATTGTSPGDILKYLLAAAVAIAGMVAFYLFPQWPGALRGLIVILGFAGALALLAMTVLGLRGRDFLSESMFELRKVVWPTKDEATRITLVVLAVVVVVSLVLAGFDLVISWLIKLLLSN